MSLQIYSPFFVNPFTLHPARSKLVYQQMHCAGHHGIDLGSPQVFKKRVDEKGLGWWIWFKKLCQLWRQANRDGHGGFMIPLRHAEEIWVVFIMQELTNQGR